MSLFDENAAILREMEDDGSDLGPSRKVDFAHIFPSRAAADAFAGRATQDGFEVMVEEVDRADDPWDVTASKDIVPSAENITAVEEQFAGLAGMEDVRRLGLRAGPMSNVCLRPVPVIRGIFDVPRLRTLRTRTPQALSIYL